MKKLSFIVTCECTHPNKIPWIEELAGEKRRMKCRKCNSLLKIEFPHSPPESTKLIPRSKKSNAAKGYLELIENEYARQKKYPLKKKTNKVGRFSNSSNADVALLTNDKHISRVHFTIKTYDIDIGAKKFTINSLPNTNGTILNNKLLEMDQEVYLEDGDSIKVGNSKIIFRVASN